MFLVFNSARCFIKTPTDLGPPEFLVVFSRVEVFHLTLVGC